MVTQVAQIEKTLGSLMALQKTAAGSKGQLIRLLTLRNMEGLLKELKSVTPSHAGGTDFLRWQPSVARRRSGVLTRHFEPAMPKMAARRLLASYYGSQPFLNRSIGAWQAMTTSHPLRAPALRACSASSTQQG